MKSTEIIKPSAMPAPLAYDGTKNKIPAAATGTNAASLEEGFPEVTSVPKTDGGLPPQRADFNGMFYLSTDQRTYLQNGGIITFDEEVSEAIGGYPKGAVLDYVVGSDFTKVRSLIEDNTYNFLETPLYIDDEKWEFLDFGGSGAGAGAPIGSIFPTFCTDTYIPLNCLPCNGSEYSSEQFGLFYTNYLVAGKLLTCTYEEYAASVSTYGKCAKFAVDATVGSFKTPYLPDGSFIQQAMSAEELGKSYKAGLPSMTHSHTASATSTTNTTGNHSHTFSTKINLAAGMKGSGDNWAGTQSSTNYDNANYTTRTTNAGDHSHTVTTSVTIANNINQNPVYGNSTTVQPESVALRWFVVVGTGSINEADMDWSAWATSLNGRASNDLTNLTPVGEKHFVNKSQITNCILEAPERIKYTLEGGTLTIKAESVVIVPYGLEDLSAQFPVGSTFINENFQVYDSQYSDGKFFVWVKLVNDLSADRNTEDVYRRTLFIIFSDTASDVPLQAGINSSSGTTVPKNGYLYNTSTNKVSYYNTSSELTYETCSLPLGIVKANGEIVFSSIEQMFHSVGYIGGLAWIDKGIKALMPNGRNSDRTINNLHYETPELMFYDQTGLTGLRSLILRADNTFNRSVGYHVGDDGYLHQDDHIYSKFIGFEFANITAESGQILSIVPRNAFQAANAQDLDGVWMKNSVLLADNLSLSTGNSVEKIFDLSAFLPNDGKLYEVLVSGSANLGNVNGAYINSSIYSPDINIWTRLMVARNTASSNCSAGGSALNLIGSLRKLIINADVGVSPVKVTLYLEAYRKVR